SVRMILPGITYQLPPAQDKLNLFDCDIEKIMARFLSCNETDVAKAIMSTLEGVSPLLARELASRATKGLDIPKENLSEFYKERVANEILGLKEILSDNIKNYTVVVNEKKKLRDFTFIDVDQYGTGVSKTSFDSASELLDEFYANRDQVSRMKQRSHDLLKLLMNASDRITKKLALQATELAECANRDTLKIYGDLINSNLYSIEKGQPVVKLQNFYEEGCPEVEIKLDKRLTPAQNAQRYYAEYRKAATAEEMLNGLMAKSKQELIYLDSVFDAVSRTQGESELLEIREELAEQGYIRATKLKNKMLKAQPPIKYRSTDGFSILCGRNNKQNDKLTLKQAKNQDMWLHTQDIAGSHVIIESEGKEISDNAITQAAIIAAFNSKGRNSAQVAVDYTLIRYVKKPAGAKPGMVIFTDFYTAYVTPDQELVASLLVK
ncbi:MAG: NFACT RNA binding domain-containing protein, partial [Oscillospiraceae bacterium]